MKSHGFDQVPRKVPALQRSGAEFAMGGPAQCGFYLRKRAALSQQARRPALELLRQQRRSEPADIVHQEPASKASSGFTRGERLATLWAI